MDVKTFHNDPKSFCHLALPFLMKTEVENNLLIGLSTRLATETLPASPREAVFWTVRDGAEMHGAAMCTPPNDLILSHPFPSSALAALSEFLIEAHVSVPGVLGPDDAAHHFSTIWTVARGMTADLWRRERIYRLDKVEALTLPPGNMIQAKREDTTLLNSYVKGFLEDTGEKGDAQAALESALSSNRLFVWFDGQPVSMAASSGPTPNGARISMVYTPPELRRRGYATAIVSTISDMLLKQGKSFCALYTDLSNPTSNSIYHRIGYRPVLDCYHYRFVR